MVVLVRFSDITSSDNEAILGGGGSYNERRDGSWWQGCIRNPGRDRRCRRRCAGRRTVRVGGVHVSEGDACQTRDKEAGGGGGKRLMRAHGATGGGTRLKLSSLCRGRPSGGDAGDVNDDNCRWRYGDALL